jgi:Spherulation-specific family 4
MLTRIRRLLAQGAMGLSRFVRGRFLSGYAVDSLQQKFAIPTYFTSGVAGDDDWLAAKTKPLLGIVVINPASGPGYTPDYRIGVKRVEYQDRINQMHMDTADAAVVGYITTNYRDSRGTSVQGEHHFTVDVATNVATTTVASGWTDGFGPIGVRPGPTGSMLPGGLAERTNYFWIALSETTGRFATSRTNATNGDAITLTLAGDSGEYVMGLSRTLANIANVFFEIDQYYERYEGIDGIFFDEMNDIGDEDDKNYYEQIFDYVKAKGGKALVVQNPGKDLPVTMLGFADVFMTFERPSSVYADHDAQLERNNPAGKFWHAIYACPADDMPGIIAASRANNAGYIYVTDRTDQQNPWVKIASYFLDEKYEVQYRNTPPAVMVRRRVPVPMILENGQAAAASKIRAVGLEPVSMGTQGPGAWVWRQSPSAGRRVARGSEVTLQLRHGPIP